MAFGGVEVAKVGDCYGGRTMDEAYAVWNKYHRLSNKL